MRTSVYLMLLVLGACSQEEQEQESTLTDEELACFQQVNNLDLQRSLTQIEETNNAIEAGDLASLLERDEVAEAEHDDMICDMELTCWARELSDEQRVLLKNRCVDSRMRQRLQDRE